MTYIHMQKFKVNGQSVPKIEWKQTDRRTDGGDRITSLVNEVGNDKIEQCRSVAGLVNNPTRSKSQPLFFMDGELICTA